MTTRRIEREGRRTSQWALSLLVVVIVAASQAPRLQGRAVADSTISEDSNGVALWLWAVAPQSYVQPISRPGHVRRPSAALSPRPLSSPQSPHAAIVADGTGTITGVVVDHAGAVRGALITVTNVATWQARTAQTDLDGTFRILGLRPGAYAVKVNMEGYRAIDAYVKLSADEVRDLNKLTLASGGIIDTVNVLANSVPVQTTTALRKSLTSDLLAIRHLEGHNIFDMLNVGSIAAGTRVSIACIDVRGVSSSTPCK